MHNFTIKVEHRGGHITEVEVCVDIRKLIEVLKRRDLKDGSDIGGPPSATGRLSPS